MPIDLEILHASLLIRFFQFRCLFIVNPKKLKLSTHSIGVSLNSSWNLGILFAGGEKSYILIC